MLRGWPIRLLCRGLATRWSSCHLTCTIVSKTSAPAKSYLACLLIISSAHYFQSVSRSWLANLELEHDFWIWWNAAEKLEFSKDLFHSHNLPFTGQFVYHNCRFRSIMFLQVQGVVFILSQAGKPMLSWTFEWLFWISSISALSWRCAAK